jgi:hypothetical protein
MAPLKTTDQRDSGPEWRVDIHQQATLVFDDAELDLPVLVEVADRLVEQRIAWRIAFARSNAAASWRRTDDRQLTDLVAPQGRQWQVELAAADDEAGCRIKLTRVPPWRDEAMASWVTIRFPDDVRADEMTAFATWAARQLPLRWATFGPSFDCHPVPGFLLDDDRVYALAKRYWAVQVLDPVLLLRDAVTAMPGFGWLSVVGATFVEMCESSLDRLAGACAAAADKGVFHRRAGDVLLVAAGPRPLLGDINLDEDLTAYACVAEILAPLCGRSPQLGAGSVEYPERHAAWLTRFVEPGLWFEAP